VESHAWEWVDRNIWTERMLAALVTASSKGNQGKWFSLIDKVWRDSTLQAAWEQVKRKRGAGGIDCRTTQGRHLPRAGRTPGGD